MEHEDLIHDWMVTYLQNRLSRDYDEIKINLTGHQENEFNGSYPDLILSNHGLVLAVMEVETEQSVTPGRAAHWKTLAGQGAKLILMVPKQVKAKAVDLLWKEGLVDRASVGSYEISIQMP